MKIAPTQSLKCFWRETEKEIVQRTAAFVMVLTTRMEIGRFFKRCTGADTYSDQEKNNLHSVSRNFKGSENGGLLCNRGLRTKLKAFYDVCEDEMKKRTTRKSVQKIEVIRKRRRQQG